MVHKVKLLKIIIYSLIFVIFGVLSLAVNRHVETNLVKTILPKSVIESTNIVPIANNSSSIIRVVFESSNEDNLTDLKSNFIDGIDKTYFDVITPDYDKVLPFYLDNPGNFLSLKTRKLLKNKQYDEVYDNSLARLYNPTGIQLGEFDKDPYLLTEDFLLSNNLDAPGNKAFGNKFYVSQTIKIKNKDGLSPSVSNKKISKLINLQRKLSRNNTKIYLAGSPIHSYYTSVGAALNINIICVLSTLLIIFLTYFYFRNIKIIFAVIMSILFGMLAGYATTKLWFSDFQIITMVFSTILIGIGIDYSYHYFFTIKKDIKFVKNLTLSMLSTVVPFVFLYFTGIEILKQISVFIIAGLFSIYLFVLFLYPCFDFPQTCKTIKLNGKIPLIILLILLLAGGIGYSRLSFNDSLSCLYTPGKNLSYAEQLYNKVSGQGDKNSEIITVEADDFEGILQKEERVAAYLDEKNIKYISISKFLPSKKRQNENLKLVQKLYKSNLNNFSDLLSPKQILELKGKISAPVDFESTGKTGMFNTFFLNKNTSMMIVFSDLELKSVKDSGINVINLSESISQYMKSYRNAVLNLFPVVFAGVILLLSVIYGFKKGLKMTIPSIAGILSAVGICSLIWGEINLFSIIALFLIFGFTIDYSIFRAAGEKQSEDAVFISCLTTTFSFLLLSFTNFKFLSSMSTILFFGIAVSYLFGLYLYKSSKDKE